VGVGVLGFAFTVHDLFYVLFIWPRCRPAGGVFQHEIYLKLWYLFNIEHYDVKLKTINIQGKRRIDIQSTNKISHEPWWVVQTKPQHEVQAMTHLEQQGMTTYCPQFQQEFISQRQVKLRITPLFPRYVFVLANGVAQQQVHRMRSTVGVSQLIKVGDVPCTLDVTVIKEIMTMEASHLHEAQSYFKADDAVLITGGLYHGLEGVYQLDQGLERAVVLLNLLQHPTRLSIDKTKLKKIS
jgi:transcriptional antiterminator RfaH